MRACRRWLLSQPGALDARLLLGASLMALGRYAEARIEMLAARRRSSDVAAVHRLLGEACLRLGKVAEAREALQRAADLDPRDEAVRGLLEELGASEAPPPAATIERWFSPQDLVCIEGMQKLAELIGEPTRIGSEEEKPAVAPPPAVVPPPAAELETVPEEAIAVPLETVPGDELGQLAGEEELAGEPTQATVEWSLSSAELPDEKASGEGDLPDEPTRVTAPAPRIVPTGGGASVEEGTRPVRPAPRSRRPTLSFGVPPPPVAPSPSMPTFGASASPKKVSRTSGFPGPNPSVPVEAGVDPLESEPTRAAAAPPVRDAEVRSEGSDAEATREHTGTDRLRQPLLDRLRAGGVRLGQWLAVRRARLQGMERRRLLTVALGGVLLVSLSLGGGLWWSSRAREARWALVERAWASGLRLEVLEAARRLAVQEEPEAFALQAWAMADYEEAGEGASEGGLDDLPEPWHSLALGWKALEAGRGAEARRHAASLERAAEDAGAERERSVLRAEAALLAARAALLVGDVERAEAGVRLAARSWSEGTRARLWRGLLAALRGASSEALTALGTAARQDDHPGVRLVEAWVAWRTARVEEARGGAEAVLQGLREQASRWQLRWAALLLAEAALAQGDGTRGREALQQAEGVGGAPSASARLRMASGWLALGEVSRAEKVLEGLGGEAMLPGLAALRVRIALKSGRLEEAARRLEHVPRGPQRDLLEAHLLLRRGRRKQAARLFERVIAARPAEPDALFALARIALDRGDAARADRWLDRLPAAEARSVRVTALRAEARMLQGRPQEALGLLRAALRTTPASRDLRRLRGRALRQMGRGLEAVEALSPLAEEAPGDAAIQVELAEAAMDSGRWQFAQEALERAGAGGGGLEVALARARFALMQWEPDAAAKAIERAKKLGGGSRRVRALALRLRVLQGGGLDAARAIERAFRPRRRDAALWAALGWAYLHADDDRSIRLAVRAFGRALQGEPEHKSLDALLGMAWAHVLLDRPVDASRYIGEADRVLRGSRTGPAARARLAAARARVDYHREDYESAEQRIAEALEEDERASEAWWVRALVADERAQPREVVEALDRALQGRLPRPVMRAARLLRSPRPAEACTWARAYLRASPRGEDAREVRDFEGRHCR